jgi:hypothetical protein
MTETGSPGSSGHSADDLSAAERREVIQQACLARSEIMSRPGHTFSPPLMRGDLIATLVVSALGLLAMYLGFLA